MREGKKVRRVKHGKVKKEASEKKMMKVRIRRLLYDAGRGKSVIS